MIRIQSLILVLFLMVGSQVPEAWSDAISDNPIVFVTMVPNPSDFGTLAATFGNHIANPDTAYRGGDLWIRYSDGSLKNLTQAAGLGNSGFQGVGAIAVRDPSVHWDGAKVIFSMVVGAATQRYQVNTYRWQLYEISGLGVSDTPVVTKVANQPEEYNNMSPTYASDDSIIFTSDRPRDSTVLHTYPQRDEYESSPVNSGLWKIQSSDGSVVLIDHAPSGDFNPIVDSFGRIIFTRWDHLQRDQQNVGGSFGAFNYESEVSTVALSSAAEVFPEPRSVSDSDYQPTLNLFTINQFFPWMANQDGTGLETLNHVGRQEIGLYSERSFNSDSNIQEFYGQYTTGQNQNDFTIFLHIKELPNIAGTYVGTSCQEFGTHSGGQLLTISGAPGVNPDNMLVSYLTHPDTAGASDNPSGNHSGLYRDPLPLSNGKLLSVHTANTRQDANIGSSAAPLSRYDFRIKFVAQSGPYYLPSTSLTSGISKSVSFWSPDDMVSYSGPLWEMTPVELKSRTRPSFSGSQLPAIESAVLADLGVQESELVAYLKQQNLALLISRNLTTRDRNDRQQPTNLRVTGSATESLPHSGTIYDISFLQFFQGDLIRGYSSGSNQGRRVLAQPLHSVASGINIPLESAPNGAVKIATDGSMAAFVPAGRALSWHTTDASGQSVVKERYWLTFQPGEIRVCASCHGINTADHLGQTEPTNSPQALVEILAHWKSLPASTPSFYILRLQSKTKKAKSKFTLKVTGGEASDKLVVKAKIKNMTCSGSKSLASSTTSRSLKGTLPSTPGLSMQLSLLSDSSSEVLKKASLKIIGKSKKYSSSTLKKACSALIKSLKK